MTPVHHPASPRVRSQDGFTLVELLVVVVILGVLAGVVVFAVRGLGDKGRTSAVAADAAVLRTAEEAYCAKHGRYGTVEDLRAAGLLTGEPVYNMVLVGEENKCGRGEKSSFVLNDTTVGTDHLTDAIAVGTGAADLAVDEKANRVYVVAAGGNSVTVIDGRTDTPLGGPVDVSSAGVTNPTRIAVGPGTGRVFVGGVGGVAVIDTANANQVTKIDGFSATVTALAVSPENGELYIGGGPLTASSVSYVPAGSSSATPITLPAMGLVAALAGTDFAFDPVHHTVYLAKGNSGTGTGAAAGIGLFAISTQTHTATLVTRFPTRSSLCPNSPGEALATGSARGSIAVDPNRNLVYLLAKRCVSDPANPAGNGKPVATTIVVNPADGTSTPINDPVGTPYSPVAAVYNPTAGSVYVQLDGGANCGNGNGGRVDRIVGTTVVGQTPVCGVSTAQGNQAHKFALLRNFNRLFIANSTYGGGGRGGLGQADGSTLLPRAALSTSHQFSALATNNTTAKVYAVDPVDGTLSVFRTGPA